MSLDLLPHLGSGAGSVQPPPTPGATGLMWEEGEWGRQTRTLRALGLTFRREMLRRLAMGCYENKV